MYGSTDGLARPVWGRHLLELNMKSAVVKSGNVCLLVSISHLAHVRAQNVSLKVLRKAHSASNTRVSVCEGLIGHWV